MEPFRAEMDNAAGPKRARKTTQKFNKYIEEIKKTICPGFGLTADGSDCFNTMINITLAKIFQNMDILTTQSDRKTLNLKDVDAALRLTFDPSLYAAANTYAASAVTAYSGDGKEPKSATTRSNRAGLILPVTRIETLMMNTLRAKRKTATSAVFLTGSVENVMRRLFKATGEEAAAQRKQRLTQLHISRAVDADPSLAALYQNCILTLDPKRSKAKRAKKKSDAAARAAPAQPAAAAPPADRPPKAKRVKKRSKSAKRVAK